MKLSNKVLAYSILSTICILMNAFPEFKYIICGIPFVGLCGLKSKSSLVCAVMLIVILSSYLYLLFSPVYCVVWFMRQQSFVPALDSILTTLLSHYCLVIYSPLSIILFMNIRKPSRLMLFLQDILWDYPLLGWMQCISIFGYRALKVCVCICKM